MTREYYGGKNNPYETIKIIEHLSLDFCLGNVIKYVSRAGKKDPSKYIEDLKKAAYYLNREIISAEEAEEARSGSGREVEGSELQTKGGESQPKEREQTAKATRTAPPSRGYK